MKWDVAIIGAGVVGLACAERLSREGRSVIVLERHASFGQETSSRNSEVVHAGLYYPTDSLKARLCVEGRHLLNNWCSAHDVPHARIGKLIVAVTSEEEPALNRLLQQAHANDVTSVVPLSSTRLSELEPNVRAVSALWSPESAIIDSHALMRTLHQAARDHGTQFAWLHPLDAVERTSGGWSLRVGAVRIEARSVINSAGLDADRIAALTGLDIDAAGYRLTWVKGRYFRVRRPGLVSHLVYPIPPLGLTGLGIHATVDLSGGLRLGPDVDVLPDRHATYDVPESAALAFHRAASRYLPTLALEDLSPDLAGIRPRLGQPGSAARDFVIAEESARGLPGWVNLIGIESPGLTASLAIARHVEDLLRQRD